MQTVTHTCWGYRCGHKPVGATGMSLHGQATSWGCWWQLTVPSKLDTTPVDKKAGRPENTHGHLRVSQLGSEPCRLPALWNYQKHFEPCNLVLSKRENYSHMGGASHRAVTLPCGGQTQTSLWSSHPWPTSISRRITFSPIDSNSSGCYHPT